MITKLITIIFKKLPYPLGFRPLEIIVSMGINCREVKARKEDFWGFCKLRIGVRIIFVVHYVGCLWQTTLKICLNVIVSIHMEIGYILVRPCGWVTALNVLCC